MRVVSLVLFFLIPLRVAVAQVADKLDPVRVDIRWDSIPWGGTLDDVSGYVERSLETRSRVAVSGMHDQHQRDTIRQENAAAAKAFRESVIDFGGQKTGYNLSVVNRDFAHDSKESMAVLSAGKATDYFFFQDGKLWRLVTTDASKAPFAALMVELTAQYGNPADISHSDARTKTDPVGARWTSDVFAIEAESRSDYATRLVRWTWRPIGDRIASLRGEKCPPGTAKVDVIDPAILDIMTP